jgi:hypothetical protein
MILIVRWGTGSALEFPEVDEWETGHQVCMFLFLSGSPREIHIHVHEHGSRCPGPQLFSFSSPVYSKYFQAFS